MRTIPSTLTTAIAKDVTQPVYLIRASFGNPPDEYRFATWAAAITWNGEPWIASGAKVSNLSPAGAVLQLPNGTSDPWLALILNNPIRNLPISIYEHYTDTAASPQADAVLIFTGIMDQAVIDKQIKITVLESSQARSFPADSIDRPIFNHLLNSGDTINWGSDTVIVN